MALKRMDNVGIVVEVMRLTLTLLFALIACVFLMSDLALAQTPEVQQAVAPSYPRLPPGFRESGEVQVEIAITRSGEVSLAKATMGPDRLRGAAESAARKWRFKPQNNATEKWVITFAFIMQQGVTDPPLIASVFVSPNRMEIFEKARETITISDPAVVDVEKARRQKQK